MDNYWIAILPILTMIGGLAYWGMQNYIGEKLKNIATHEDIGKITNEVEDIKQTFTIQNENLKQQLSVLTNKENVLFAEEKEALLAYLSAWNIWNSQLEKMVDRFIMIEEEEENDWFTLLDKFEEENDKTNDKIQICVSKLELFITDEFIIKTVHDLNYETYQFQFLNDRYIDSRIDTNIYLGQCVEEHNLAEKKKNKDDQEDFLVLVSDETDNKETTYREYNNSLLELEEKIDQLKTEFIKLSKEYIRKGIS